MKRSIELSPHRLRGIVVYLIILVATFAAPQTAKATTNLALNKPATQSSTRHGQAASRANDGNRNGFHANGSISHTEQEQQPWWQVDLQAEYRLNKISIFKQLDSCCLTRMREFYVFVSKTDLSGRSLSDILSDPNISHTYYEAVAPDQLDLTNPGVGRYIRIQRTTNSGNLVMSEVEAYGTPYSVDLIAHYHLDGTEWDGIAGEIADTAGYSGGPFDGTAIGSPLPNPNFTEPAKAGTTGTCGYAELNSPVNGGGAFNFTNLPFDTASGDLNSVSFWLYWDGTNQVMPLSSNGYSLAIYNNKLGFSQNGTDIYGIDFTGKQNGWHHIVAVFHQGNLIQNKLYLDGTLQTLSQQNGNLRVQKAFFDAADYATPAHGTSQYFVPNAPWYSDNVGGDIEIMLGSSLGAAGPARSIMELEAENGDASNLKANIPTSPGDLVYVSFDHADRAAYEGSHFYVYIDNKLAAFVKHASTSFAHFEYSGYTDSTNTLIELRANSNNGRGVALDDIKIETQSASGLNGTMQTGGTSANSNYRFTGRLDEIKFYRGEIDQAQVTADYQATHACPDYVVNVDAHNFNCIAEQETNLASGHLYMQIAKQPFNIKVVALKSDGSAETDFAAASDKTISIGFLDQNNANSPIIFNDGSNKSSKSLTFTTTNNTGIVSVNGLMIPNAYRKLTCQVTDSNQSPAKVVNASDSFSVRPLGFTLSSDANADSTGTNANANPVVVAGENFTINAETNTLGYDGTPILDTGQLLAHASAYQTGLVTGSFHAANGSTGNSSSSFTYSEVGYFRVNAFGVYDNSFTNIDLLNGDCTNNYANTATAGKYGCHFANQSHSDYVGRFIPKYFNVDDASNITTAACGNFSYYGQDGLSTQFVLRATRADGGRTKNYQGAYAKLDVNTWNNSSAAAGLRFSSANLPTGVSYSSGAVRL